MKKRILSLVLAVIMLLGAMPVCASAEAEDTLISEISLKFDVQAVIGKTFYEYSEFVKILSPNLCFEPDTMYSSLIFFDADTGEQVRDEIVDGEEYGVCLKLYPAEGYSIADDSRVIINGRKLTMYSNYEITFGVETKAKVIMFGIIAGEEFEYKKIDSVSLSFDSVACAGKSPSAYSDIITINSENISFVDYEADVDGNGTKEHLPVLNIYRADGTKLAMDETMQAGEQYFGYIYLVADFGYYFNSYEIGKGIDVNDGADRRAGYGVGVGRNGRNFISVGVRFVAGEPLEEQNDFKSFIQKIVEFFERIFEKIIEIFR